MNVLFLYGTNAGDNKVIKKLPYILKNLSSIFVSVTSHLCESEDELVKSILNMNTEDALIFAGGDGTFNLVINTISKLEHRPIIGYLPTGTLNDAARCFGIPRSLNKALKVIKNQHYENFDVIKTNEGYFSYMSAIGQYSDISYIAKRKNKRRLGRFSYYNLAIKEAFEHQEIELSLFNNDKEITIKTPFLMILNGTHIAGFSVNKKSSLFDGKFEIYWSERGIFNGLLHYITKRKVHVVQTNSAVIRNISNLNWCLDGEKKGNSDLNIECLQGYLTLYSNKKSA